MGDVVEEFDKDMMGVYRAAKSECSYNAVRFLEMLHDMRGLRTARRLLSTENAQYGFDKLWECRCLHLTVECLVLRPKYQPLFEDTELEQARKRLKAHGYDPAKCER